MKHLLSLLLFSSATALWAQSDYRVTPFPTQFPSLLVLDSIEIRGPIDLRSNFQISGSPLPSGQGVVSNGTTLVATELLSAAAVRQVISDSLTAFNVPAPTLADVVAQGNTTSEALVLSGPVTFTGLFSDADGILPSGEVLMSTGTAMRGTSVYSKNEVDTEISTAISEIPAPPTPSLSDVVAEGDTTGGSITINGNLTLGSGLVVGGAALGEDETVIGDGLGGLSRAQVYSKTQTNSEISSAISAIPTPTLAQVVASGSTTGDPITLTDDVAFEGNIVANGVALTEGQSLLSNGSTLYGKVLAAPSDVYAILKAREDSVFGFVDINHSDVAIEYSPSAPIRLPNDGAGSQTNTSYLPTPIPNLAAFWNTTDDNFIFSDLPLGTVLKIRVDVAVTTTAADQEVTLTLHLGGSSPFSLILHKNVFKTAGAQVIVTEVPIYIGSADVRNNIGYFTFQSDAPADVLVNGWFVDMRLNY